VRSLRSLHLCCGSSSSGGDRFRLRTCIGNFGATVSAPSSCCFGNYSAQIFARIWGHYTKRQKSYFRFVAKNLSPFRKRTAIPLCNADFQGLADERVVAYFSFASDLSIHVIGLSVLIAFAFMLRRAVVVL